MRGIIGSQFLHERIHFEIENLRLKGMEVDPSWMVSPNQSLIVFPIASHLLARYPSRLCFPIRAHAHPKHAINAPMAERRGCVESQGPLLAGCTPSLYESLVLSSAVIAFPRSPPPPSLFATFVCLLQGRERNRKRRNYIGIL